MATNLGVLFRTLLERAAVVALSLKTEAFRPRAPCQEPL